MYEICFPFILFRKPGEPCRYSFLAMPPKSLSIILLEEVPYTNKFIYAESVSYVTTSAGDLYLKHAMC
jgi:hypothetical protein